MVMNKSKDGKHRFVVPTSYVEELMKLNHNIPMTGHQEVDRIRKIVKLNTRMK